MPISILLFQDKKFEKNNQDLFGNQDITNKLKIYPRLFN